MAERPHDTPIRPALRPGRSARTWLRYNWPKLLLHVLLIVFGLANLYPFFWMVGTSLKAEAEASTECLTPIPKLKYRLSPGFRLETVLPDALAPGLAEVRRRLEQVAGHVDTSLEALEREQVADGQDELIQARERCTTRLDRLKRKLQVIHRMQQNAWRENLRHRLATALAEIGDPEMAAFDEATKAARQEVRRARAALNQAQTGRAGLRQALAEAEAQLEVAQAVLTLFLDERMSRLVDAGILESTKQGHWLGERWFGAVSEEPAGAAGLLPALRDHYSVTPRKASVVTKYDLAESEEQLAALADLGALVRVEAGAGEEGPAYMLAAGARERNTADGLYPRQVLTLWSMRDENIRRSESRETYAKDRRAADDYADLYVKDKEQARVELEEMAEKGFVVPGRTVPINYWVVLKEENFILHFMTSLLVTLVVVLGTIMLSSMLGYALARLRFPGKMVVLGVMIAASVLPGEARTIPIFRMLLAIGFMGNLWGMVTWLTSFGVGNALLMAGFFLTLPKEVDEAAEVDGAGVLRKFFDIALPMARPIVMTVGLFAFLASWNNFLVPLLCTISRPSMQPLAVAVYNFQQGHPGKWHQINAAAAIMIIPVILMFLFVQKYVVKAIAVGAVKG